MEKGGWWDTPTFLSNTVLPKDLKLQEVYGNYVHQNPGTHLTRGIVEDAVWQDRWTLLVALPTFKYNCPGGAIGKDFVTLMTALWEGIMDDKHNSEFPIVFMMVIL